MNEFKFSCPKCRQNIEATPEYSGMQINCPSCQALLVVPQPSEAPPPMPSSRLTKSASTPGPATPAPTRYVGPPIKKKKSNTGKIVGWSVGACVALALVIFGPKALRSAGFIKSDTAAADTATNAVTNSPPPELTTREILQKVNDTYKNISDYSATAQTAISLDTSALMGGKGGGAGAEGTSSMLHSAMELSRSDYYRLEWELPIPGGKPIKFAAWNAGGGNYVGTSAKNAKKVKTREEALKTAIGSLVLSSVLMDNFFSTSNSIAELGGEFTKTNAPNLDNGESYVLVGETNHVTMLACFDKKSFLLTKFEVILSGQMPISDEELKKLSSADRAGAMMFARLKGNIIESYTNIRTNRQLLGSTFVNPIQDDTGMPSTPDSTPARNPSMGRGGARPVRR